MSAVNVLSMPSSMRLKVCLMLVEVFSDVEVRGNHILMTGPRTRDEATMIDVAGSIALKISSKTRLPVKSLKSITVV